MEKQGVAFQADPCGARWALVISGVLTGLGIAGVAAWYVTRNRASAEVDDLELQEGGTGRNRLAV